MAVAELEPEPFTALIVDDEPEICRLSAEFLSKEGFICTTASNGAEALSLMERARYDVLITDLRMPVLHGHSLAVQALQRSPRPVVIVMTSVVEPRLAKDLISRGVDDIIFKPVRFPVFSAKVSAIVRRARMIEESRSPLVPDSLPLSEMEEHAPKFPTDEYQIRIEGITGLPPFSPAVLDIFQMASSEQGDAEQLAANLARDASLAVEVLRLANSAYYNPCGESITQLRIAVARIGRRRIGALALSRHLMALSRRPNSEVLDTKLAWRQSIGAGVAIELLVDAGGFRCVCDELFLCALMHSLGRLVLVSTFPEVYSALIDTAVRKHTCLADEEAVAFPEPPSTALLRLLQHWGIKSAIYEPLNYVSQPYSSLTNLPEPLRTQVELLKIAGLIGRIAAGTWEKWDIVELPPATILQRLRLAPDALERIIQRTVEDSDRISSFSSLDDMIHPVDSGRPKATHSIRYLIPRKAEFDWLPYLVPAMGIRSVQFLDERRAGEGPYAINLLDRSERELAILTKEAQRDDLLLLPRDQTNAKVARNIAVLPNSFSRLRHLFLRIAQPLESPGSSILNPKIAGALAKQTAAPNISTGKGS